MLSKKEQVISLINKAFQCKDKESRHLLIDQSIDLYKYHTDEYLKVMFNNIKDWSDHTGNDLSKYILHGFQRRSIFLIQKESKKTTFWIGVIKTDKDIDIYWEPYSEVGYE